MKEMSYGAGSHADKGHSKGNMGYKPNEPGNGGTHVAARGSGVEVGLSERAEFYGESNASLGLDRPAGSKNQMPKRPKSNVSTDRGKYRFC